MKPLSGRSRRGLVIAVAVVALIVGVVVVVMLADRPQAPRDPGFGPGDPVIAAAGDIACHPADRSGGWFHSSLLAAVGVRAAPYRQVITHGFVLSENGMPYSKCEIAKAKAEGRKIDYVEPDDRREEVRPRDVPAVGRLDRVPQRHHVLADDPIRQRRQGGLAEWYRKLRNTARFLLGNLKDFDPDAHDRSTRSRSASIATCSRGSMTSSRARAKRTRRTSCTSCIACSSTSSPSTSRWHDERRGERPRRERDEHELRAEDPVREQERDGHERSDGDGGALRSRARGHDDERDDDGELAATPRRRSPTAARPPRTRCAFARARGRTGEASRYQTDSGVIERPLWRSYAASTSDGSRRGTARRRARSRRRTRRRAPPRPRTRRFASSHATSATAASAGVHLTSVPAASATPDSPQRPRSASSEADDEQRGGREVELVLPVERVRAARSRSARRARARTARASARPPPTRPAPAAPSAARSRCGSSRRRATPRARTGAPPRADTRTAGSRRARGRCPASG